MAITYNWGGAGTSIWDKLKNAATGKNQFVNDIFGAASGNAMSKAKIAQGFGNLAKDPLGVAATAVTGKHIKTAPNMGDFYNQAIGAGVNTLKTGMGAVGNTARAGQVMGLYDTGLYGMDTGGYGSGGGGYGSGGGMSQDQINANLSAMQAIIEGRYADAITALTNAGNTMKANVDASRKAIETGQAASTGVAQQQAQNARSVSRQDYQDALVQARRRAVASGAGSGSGYLDTTSKLDQALMQTLSDVNFAEMNNIQKINLTAQEAINTLENDLSEKLNAIENEKAMTARDKEQAVLEAQINAANQALEVQSWASNRSSGWGSSSVNNNQAAASAYAQAQQKMAEIDKLPYLSDNQRARLKNEVQNNMDVAGTYYKGWKPTQQTKSPTAQDLLIGKVGMDTTPEQIQNYLSILESLGLK